MTSATLEFFKRDQKVMVLYNLSEMTLTDFCRLDEARIILVKMCRAVLRKEGKPGPCRNTACLRETESGHEAVLPETCDYLRIVGDFIHRHLLGHDDMLDVIVSGNSESVRFQTEK